MTDFFHLATPEQWAGAQITGLVAPPSLEAEGFIHCSTEAQLAGTIERHFTTATALALLRLDAESVADALQWDEVRPDQVYPHVYRPIRVAEVLEVRPWKRGSAT